MPRESAELERIGINLRKKIGSGSFSHVYSGSSKMFDGKVIKVAVKIMQMDKIADDRFANTFVKREIDIVQKVKHPHIAEVFEIFSIGDSTVIIGALYECDLLQYVQQRGCIVERVARRLLLEIVSAVKYLHDINIVHRDIKTENLFLAGNGALKLGDFGFSRFVSGLCDTQCGSTGYIAPEVTHGGDGIDAKLSDVWSIGVVMFTITVNQIPFDRRDYILMNKKKSVVIKFPSRIVLTGRFRDILGQLLKYDPTERINLADVPKHPWILENTHRGSHSSRRSTNSLSSAGASERN